MKDPRSNGPGAPSAGPFQAPETSTPERPGVMGRDPGGELQPEGRLPEGFRIEAPAVSLPQGGGAIGGMGEKFAANPVTGSANLTLPLPATPARGVAPALSLSYDSGAGNGPFGMGFRLSLPSVSRKTSRGLPRYFDEGDQADVYLLSDAEDLVPMLSGSGSSWSQVERSYNDGTDDWTIRRYRPRTEGAFTLIERWTRDTDGFVWWRTISAANVQRVYGRSTQARVVDPDDSSKVFEWLLEEERDELGSVISYQYAAEDRAGVDTTHPAERARALSGHKATYRYPKRVSWGNSVMGNNPDDGGSGTFRFHLVFDYGGHSATDPALSPAGTWDVRDDTFSSFRSGFDLRCYRLCQRVLLFHEFTEIRASGSVAVPAVVRSLELSYTERATVSTLASAQVKGWRWNGSSYDTATLPALSLSWQEPELGESVELVSGLDDMPHGIDPSQWQWVDLDGEGLRGLLTQVGGSWYWKRNEGKGQLGAIRQLDSHPSPGLGAGRLADLDGDGRLEMLYVSPGLAGYAPRDPDGTWSAYRPFRQLPAIPQDDPDARLIDLNGDGIADLMIAGDEVFTWHPSLGREGFDEARRRPWAVDEDEGPRLLFSRDRESIYLADMTGDGLSDLVRVRQGAVCYWPNRGWGRFGAKVLMKDAPWFDHPDRFDPACIRLNDIDGSGPADLIYLGADGVKVWFNQSGNGWSAASTLAVFPPVTKPIEVQVADLLGDGTACLTWSSPLLSDGARPLQYVSLMSQGKPWLLTSITNNMGREVRLSYTPSTTFYHQDRQAGTPWATRLPFPVQCLSQIESVDHVTGWRFVQVYAYHHGYYDGPEREFRGFGMVEAWDTETFRDFEDPNLADPSLVDGVPPVRTRTWFHTGAWRNQGTLEAAYATEYSDADSSAASLPASALPSGLPPSEERQAARCLRGAVLRTEVYAEDGSGKLDVLYTTSQQRYNVTQLQPADGQHPAVFMQHPAESLSYSYDLDLTSGTPDPRVSHSLTLSTDAYNRVTCAASVVYPRRGTGHDSEQTSLHVLIQESEYEHQDSQVVSDDLWRIGVLVRSKTWALTGTTNYPDDSDIATITEVSSDFSSATAVDFEDDPGTGLKKRLIGHQVTTFWNDGLTAALNVGSVGLRALPHQRYILAMTSGLVTDIYSTNVSSTDLTDAGYVDLDSDNSGTGDGDWWIPSGRLTHDASNFYVPTSHTDPFGNTTTLTWDTERLALTEVEDAVGLETTADIDYQTLAPYKVTDPSGTESQVTLDALGRVTELAIRNGTDGDGSSGHSAEFDYQTTRWQTSALPNRVKSKKLQTFGGSDWLEAYAYSDGGGNVVQIKAPAAPGDAPERDTNGDLVFVSGVLQYASADPRYVGNGRVIVDNKGNLVRQYEPFFSSLSDYEDEVEVVEQGVSAELHYDPVGRNTRVDLPDGNFRSWVYTPWSVSAYDEEDNLSSGDHEDTPAVTHLDSLGRAYKSVVTPDGSNDHETTVELDIQGNALTVTDARGNDIQVRSYDLLGRPLFTGAADEGYDGSSGDGETTAFFAIDGQPVKIWRSGSLTLRRVYDDLRRPRELYVNEGSGESLVELTVYGDELTDSADASTVANDFLKGRPYQVYDTAGRVTFVYDFRGLVLEQTRTLIDDITADADWSGLETEDTISDIDSWVSTNGGLTSEDFTVETAYDALGRVTEQTAPDTSVTTPGYDEGGRLTSVEVNIRGASTATTFVDEITYNARGQRLSITYGNNTSSTYTYDDERLWLDTVQTTRSSSSSHGSATLQSLTFTRDAVGNITQIADAAQETLFFDNTQVTSTRTFSYDSLYRLTQATGREKVSQTQTTAKYLNYASAMGVVPDSTTTALRTYTQQYSYDETGNITLMLHKLGATTEWGRAYEYETDNNQLTKSNGPSESHIAASSTWTPAYSYNARGAMTFLPHLKTGVSTNITRDFRDQIRKADLDNSGNVAWYSYDAAGQRVRKLWDKGAIEEERIYIGGYEVWRKFSSSTLQEERETLHVMDGARRIAMVETLTVTGGSTVGTPTPRQRYQYDDHLGTVSLEADDDGGVITYEEYHPYGSTAWWAEKSGINVSRKRYRYTGKEKDEETGLCYHGHRYYMPWLGRWERADPIGLGDGVNRFRYVSNNPVRLNDPSGLGEVEDRHMLMAQQLESNEQFNNSTEDERLLWAAAIDDRWSEGAWKNLEAYYTDNMGLSDFSHGSTLERVAMVRLQLAYINFGQGDDFEAWAQLTFAGVEALGAQDVFGDSAAETAGKLMFTAAVELGGLKFANWGGRVLDDAFHLLNDKVDDLMVSSWRKVRQGYDELMAGMDDLFAPHTANGAPVSMASRADDVHPNVNSMDGNGGGGAGRVGDLTNVGESLGEQIFSDDGLSGLIAEDVIKNEGELIFVNFTIASQHGAGGLRGPMRELIAFGQEHGATHFTFQGTIINADLAKKYGKELGESFSVTVTADAAGILEALKLLRNQ